jgi:hypothetical protein
MLLTKTFLATAAIAGGLLASPPAAAGLRRIPQRPPLPVPRAQPSERTVIRHPALCELAAYEQPSRGRPSEVRNLCASEDSC